MLHAVSRSQCRIRRVQLRELSASSSPGICQLSASGNWELSASRTSRSLGGRYFSTPWNKNPLGL
ncbi:hypothetical protein J6590_056557 [Homalodisca vitripennis]|nr:hypothetical protein J6590_056557 [Homalodisca vitripennis]